MRAKKVRKITSNLITILLFLLLFFMIFVVVFSKVSGGEPNFLGYQLKTVLSGSMEPTFKTGSIIAIKPSSNPTEFKNGDIITFKKDESTIVTHRIIEVIKNDSGDILYKTKGDNNEDADVEPVVSQNVLAKYTGFTIPYLGYLVDMAKTKIGTALLLVIPGLLLLIYSIITVLGVLKEIDKTNKSNDTHKTA
jgi:signal peptidase I